MARERRTSGIVTPEAVLLQFETAGVASRGLARLIDLLAQAMVLYLVTMVFAALAGVAGVAGVDDPAVIIAPALVASFLVLFGYPIGCETLWGGRTLGKAAVGLRVVTHQGAPLHLRHAAIRGIVGVIEVLALPFLAVLATAISPRNQRIGDLTAGTIVVRQRSGARSAVALTFLPPRGWEHYAATLDVSVLSTDQYRVIRSFLTRVLALTPEARSRIAVRLANPVAVAMAHQPPAGLGPELFLVCVAAAYQARHGGAGSWSWPMTPSPPLPPPSTTMSGQWSEMWATGPRH